MLEHTDRLLNTRKTKYSVLNEIFKQTSFEFLKGSGRYVNIFIDLHSVLKPLYNAKGATVEEFNNIEERDRLFLTANLADLAGHYRHYFASRLGYYTNIVFLWSSEVNEDAQKLFPEYKESFYKTRSTSNGIFGLMNKNIQLTAQTLSVFLRYVPQIHFIDSKNIESNIIASHFLLIDDPSDDDFNIILTNDDLNYQNVCFKDNAYILTMKGDKSKLMGLTNTLDEWLPKPAKNKTRAHVSTLPNILSLMNPIIRQDKLNLSNSSNHLGKMRAYRKIKKLIESGDVNEEIFYSDPDIITEVFTDITPDQAQEYINKFKVTNYRYMANKYDEQIKYLMKSSIIDLYDPEAVKRFNSTWLSNYAVNLGFLYQGFDSSKHPEYHF